MITPKWKLVFVLPLGLLAWACDSGINADRRPGSAAVEAVPDLRPLLEASASPPAGDPTDARALLASREPLPEASAYWPIYTFLAAEAARAAGQKEVARSSYRALVEWAAGDPYRDGWGGSSLGGVALWRWLQHLGSGGPMDVAEVRRALVVAERLRITRLTRGLFESEEILEALPQIEEDATRRLAALAWEIGERDQARRQFLHYLTIARSARTTPTEDAIMADLVAAGFASRDRLILLRGRRLRALGRYTEAVELLREGRQSPDREARAAIGLELAELEPILDGRKRGVDRGSVARLLGTVLEEAGDPEVAQQALFSRAILLNREGPGRNPAGFERDLSTLLEEFPQGRRADDALYELARHAERGGDTPKALELYGRLRRFEGESDWTDSAYFRPAMVLYAGGAPGDLLGASNLLRELVERYPSGPFRLMALFWQARIAHESGDAAAARKLFEQVVEESPYDYYALRARLWLRVGAAAQTQLWLDPESRTELRDAFARGPADAGLGSQTAYLARLGASVRSGLYAAALGVIPKVRVRFPGRRLEEVTPEELDGAGVLARIAVLLALRQDALAATDAATAPENRLAVASALGHGVQDWPLALRIVIAAGVPWDRRRATQRSPHFLATAYPPAYADEIGRSAAEHKVRPELLYAIARMESLFNPAALSPRGALGLFQFTPDTFMALVKKYPGWRLLDPAKAESREAFLLSPKLSLDLGARWFRHELLERQDGDLLLAIMEHNAGIDAVKAWARGWERLDRRGDVEYMVETIQYSQTRIFTRRVLTDLLIADAVGFLHDRRAEAR